MIVDACREYGRIACLLMVLRLGMSRKLVSALQSKDNPVANGMYTIFGDINH